MVGKKKGKRKNFLEIYFPLLVWHVGDVPRKFAL
jgi:hypothetical protein